MTSVQTIIDSVSKHTDVRASALELVQGIAQQLKDGLRNYGVDNGRDLYDLLSQLEYNDAGLAESVVRGTMAEGRKPSQEPIEPVPNPMNPTTVGETVVSQDLSRVADSGFVTFTSKDGTTATYQQVDPDTGKPAE